MFSKNDEKLDMRLSVIRQLSVLHKKIFDTFLTIFDGDELSRTEIMIIFLLKKKSYKVSCLSNEMGIPASTLTGVIDRLIDKGYVERHRSNKDRRVVLVTLSSNIKGRIEQLSKKAQYLMKMTDKDLPETWWIDMKEKLDKLEKVMEIIKENLM